MLLDKERAKQKRTYHIMMALLEKQISIDSSSFKGFVTVDFYQSLSTLI